MRHSDSTAACPRRLEHRQQARALGLIQLAGGRGGISGDGEHRALDGTHHPGAGSCAALGQGDGGLVGPARP